MSRIRRYCALLLTLCMLVSAALLPTEAVGELAEIDQYVHNFDSAPLSDGFTDNTEGYGMSYCGGNRAWVVAGADGIAGRSLRLSNTDMRWWNVHYAGQEMGISIDVKCDDGYRDTRLYWCVQNHIGSTSTESYNGGRVIAIEPDESGAPGVYNHEGAKVATLERSKAVTLTARFAYGEPSYDILLDGQVIAAGNRFAEGSALYAVSGLYLSVGSDSSDSYITVDNLRAYSTGRKYPQTNSYQEPGALSTVTLPADPRVEGVAVYANTTRVETLAHMVGSTPLVPLAETLAAFGATATVNSSGAVTIATDRATYTLTADGKTLAWNEETVTLATPAATVDGVVYASAQVLCEVLDADAWYSEALGMVVISTGDYKTDNVLRSIGGTFWMNGKPYYEISFNKWDLANQIASDPTFNDGEYINRSWCTPETTLAGAEAALRELSEHGFRTIRVFCSNINPGRGEEALARFWAFTDKMYDLCDQYGIRVVACLGLVSNEFLDGQYVDGAGWVSGTETQFDYITDPASKSRGWVNQFLDLYIDRYKDRDTILMWEITNEGNLGADVGSGTWATYSLGQLGRFYTDMAARIKANDPTRLVTGGDSLLRSAQWHLFAATMAGQGMDWNVDNEEERLHALWTMNGGLDVISVHGYGVGYANGSGHAYYMKQVGKRYRQDVVTWELMMTEARRLDQPLYNGECGGMVDENGKEFSAGNTTPEAAAARERYLATLVEAGVQLTHWWAFRSDRVDFGMDMDTWNVTIDGTPETFAAIKAANEALQAAYMVNPLAADNTHTLSDKAGDGALTEPETMPDTAPTVSDTETPTVPTEGTTDTPDTEAPTPAGGCGSMMSGSMVSGAMLLTCLGGLWSLLKRRWD